MKVSYWIETLSPLPLLELANTGRKAATKDQPVTRLFEQSWEDSPQWCRVEDILDAWEALRNDLDILDVEASLWMRYESSDTELELDIDPLTLYRLGENNLKLCVEGHHPINHDSTHWIPTNISGCFAQADESLGLLTQRVEVWLDDHSVWEGLATTRNQLIGQLMQQEVAPRRNQWLPSLLLVPSFDEQDIEDRVVGLLKRGDFERVFRQTELADQQEIPRQSGWNVHILHDPAVLNPVLGIWPEDQRWHPCTPENQQEGLQEISRQLSALYPQLKRMGILKRDISLVWHHPYNTQVRTELASGFLQTIGSMGHHLYLNFFPEAKRIARYWSD